MEEVLFKMKVISQMIGKELSNCYDVSEASVSPTQMQIMKYLIGHKSDIIYQKDLEKVLGVSRASVSGVLQTMEKNKLVTRVISGTDARVKVVVLNESVLDSFEKGKKVLDDLGLIIRNGLSNEELMNFKKMLNKMEDNLINYVDKK